MRSRRRKQIARSKLLVLPLPSLVTFSLRRRDAEEIGRRKEIVILRRETVESALKAGRLSADS